MLKAEVHSFIVALNREVLKTIAVKTLNSESVDCYEAAEESVHKSSHQFIKHLRTYLLAVRTQDVILALNSIRWLHSHVYMDAMAQLIAINENFLETIRDRTMDCVAAMT